LCSFSTQAILWIIWNLHDVLCFLCHHSAFVLLFLVSPFLLPSFHPILCSMLFSCKMTFPYEVTFFSPWSDISMVHCATVGNSLLNWLEETKEKHIMVIDFSVVIFMTTVCKVLYWHIYICLFFFCLLQINIKKSCPTATYIVSSLLNWLCSFPMREATCHLS